MRKILGTLAAALAVSLGSAKGQTITPGNGQHSAVLPSATLNVFTYRPGACTPGRLLLVFHGVGRDAGPYRDRSRTLADTVCAIAIVAEFDSERFPTEQYQRGGSTIALVPQLVGWAEKRPASPACRTS